MKILIIILGNALLLISTWIIAQDKAKPKLLGLCSIDSSMVKLFRSWFDTTFKAYVPDEKKVASFTKNFEKNMSIEVLFGS